MNGILYVAAGKQFVNEAVCSIRSVRRVDKAIPITLRTSTPELLPELPNVTVEQIPPDNGLWVKPLHISNLPYERTLFLDTDTLVVHKDALLPFKILGDYSLALTHAPNRGYAYLRGVPNCVPTFNSGVLFINREHPETADIMQSWKRIYAPRKHKKRLSDQAILSGILWRKRATIFVLPPEWNWRGKMGGSIPKSMLRIVHHRKATRLQMRGRFKLEHAVDGTI